MWIAAAKAGALLAPFLTRLVPGIGPRTILVLLALAFSGVAIGGPAGFVWLRMRGEVKAAEAARDQHWLGEIEKANLTHAESLAAAQRRAADEERKRPTPRTASGLGRLCDQSENCRDRQRK